MGFLFSFLLFLLLSWVGVHCVIGKSSYNLSKISYFYSSPPPHPLFFPLPIPGTVSSGLIFAFAYMYSQYLHHIHPSTNFLCHFLDNWFHPFFHV
jgi:small neutral amino acid transporter SnatA (MarC family)